MADMCLLCGELVEVHDRVSNTTILDARGNKRWPHRECMLRETLGGIGHHLDHDYWCGKMHDPDAGLSYRESARRVWDLVNNQGANA